MHMESGFDKIDNASVSRGQRYACELFKTLNHFMKAARCYLTLSLEERECHMDQKIGETLK